MTVATVGWMRQLEAWVVLAGISRRLLESMRWADRRKLYHQMRRRHSRGPSARHTISNNWKKKLKRRRKIAKASRRRNRRS